MKKMPSPYAHTGSEQADDAIGRWLALALLLIYLLGYSGIFYSIDEQASLAVTESLLGEGRWRTNQMAWEQVWEPSQNALGLDGNLYSKKGMAIPLLALPFFALGKFLPGMGAIQTALLLIPLITAATGYVMYRLALLLDFSEQTAILAALAWGLATPTWPYARTLFSEPVAAFGLSLALYGLIGQRRARMQGTARLLLAGVGMALVMLARLANTVALLPLAVYWIYILWEQRANLRPGQFVWQSLAVGSVPIVALLLMMAQSYAHFGRLFGHPLDAVEGFTTPLLTGLVGLLVSPGKGLLWYLPLLFLVPLAIPGWQRQRRPEALLALSVLLSAVILYSRWWDWPGGTAWGPRLILFTTPVIVLAILPALAQFTGGQLWRRRLVVACLLLSTLVQLPGVFVNTGVLEGWEYYQGITHAQRLWTWQYTPLLSHWRSLLLDRIVDPIWLQSFFWQQPAWRIMPVIAATLMAATLIVFGLRQALHRRSSPVMQALTAVFLVILMAALPMSTQGDPRWHEQGAEPEDNQQLWGYLNQTAQRGDVAIVDMLLYYDMIGRTAGWMNTVPPQLPYIGWLRQPIDATPLPLAQWLQGYTRIWLSLAMTPADSPDSTTERWLNTWAYRGRQIWFGTQRIVEYLLPNDTKLAASTSPFRFGEDLWLDEFAVYLGRATNTRLIALTWRGVDDPDLRFSVQVLNRDGAVVEQMDLPPGSSQPGMPAVDRIAIRVPMDGYTLILKSYPVATGLASTIVNADNQEIGDFLVLDEGH